MTTSRDLIHVLSSEDLLEQQTKKKAESQIITQLQLEKEALYRQVQELTKETSDM
jgi:hypothetical protein